MPPSAAGCPLTTAANPQTCLTQAQQQAARLVILDLSMPAVDVWPRRCRALRALASGPQILAFGRHVHEDKLRLAAAAGCDAVLARGQFHAQVEQILTRYADDGLVSG